MEIKNFTKRFNSLTAGLDSDFESLMRQMLNINDPNARGPMN